MIELTPELTQNFIGFLSGLIGAGVGGWFTLYATEKTIKSNYEAQEKEEERELKALLSSLGLEVNTLWQFHQQRIGYEIEQMGEKDALLFYYPLTQDYFTIYNSNASLVGRLDDNELRKAIVVTYNKCKKVVDAFIYNNTLFLDYQRMNYETVNTGVQNPNQGAKFNELQNFAAIMKADHFKLKQYVEHLLAMLEKRGISVTFSL